jgi:hypothetical protein
VRRMLKTLSYRERAQDQVDLVSYLTDSVSNRRNIWQSPILLDMDS